MRRGRRFAGTVVLVAALVTSLVLVMSATAVARGPIPDGFCAYWGPNYSYVLPDGTIIRCG